MCSRSKIYCIAGVHGSINQYRIKKKEVTPSVPEIKIDRRFHYLYEVCTAESRVYMRRITHTYCQTRRLKSARNLDGMPVRASGMSPRMRMWMVPTTPQPHVVRRRRHRRCRCACVCVCARATRARRSPIERNHERPNVVNVLKRVRTIRIQLKKFRAFLRA